MAASPLMPERTAGKEGNMPITPYGVLKGRAIDARPEADDDTPHYQIRVMAQTTHYRTAVNVKSQQAPSELLYLIAEDFRHPVTAQLPELSHGFTGLASTPGGLALDFIRGNLFDRLAMRPLPFNLPGPDNDLNERIDHYVQRAIRDPQALVYAFGERWGPETNTADKVFHFRPGNGIHNIHMNQGNVSRFVADDGVWQDGALLWHFPTEQRWVALFLAFQSQAWHTDDRTGHALSDIPTGPGPTPTPGEPDYAVRIVAALVNPIGPAPERETVTLLNTTPQAVDLTGWAIADRLKRKHLLSGLIPPGEVVMVVLSPEVQLGNQGGIITLLDAQGLKVHGVSYTREQVQREGWTIVF
jgi:uncharacterized protein YukJ